MIRRTAFPAVLLAGTLLPLLAAPVWGQAPPPKASPDHTSFLFSAFALIWAALWVYIVAVHRGQRRVERMLGRLERETLSEGRRERE
jgi:CcmD family protein